MSIINLRTSSAMYQYTTDLLELHGGGAFYPRVTAKARQWYTELTSGITDRTWRGMSLLPNQGFKWIRYNSSNSKYMNMNQPAGVKFPSGGHSIHIVPFYPEQLPKQASSTPSFGNIRAIMAAAARGMIASVMDAGTAIGEAALSVPGFAASLLELRKGNLNGLEGLYHHGRSMIEPLAELLPDPGNYEKPPDPTPDVEWVVKRTDETLGDLIELPANSQFSSVVNDNSNNQRISNNTVNNNNYAGDVDSIIFNIQQRLSTGNLPRLKTGLESFARALDAAGRIAGLADTLGGLLRSKFEHLDPMDPDNLILFLEALKFIGDTLDYMFEEMWRSIPKDPENGPQTFDGTMIVKPESDGTFTELFENMFMNTQDESIANVMSGLLFTPSYYEQGPEYP